MSTTLVGLFDTQGEVEAARAKLMSAGFAASALSTTGGSSSAATSASSTTTTTSDTSLADGSSNEGGIVHFFKNLFGGDDEKSTGGAYGETYREAFRRGSHGLSVTAANEAETDLAEEILDECGAVDIDARSAEWRAEGWQGAALPVSAPVTGDKRTLQVIDEELQVGKRTVSRGGVRVFSRMTEVPVQETVSLREERAEVQRRPVDRPATEADFAAFKEGSVEVRESSEEAVVSKQARVIEEIEIGTQTTQRQETVHDTVRQTRVDVERLDGTDTGAGSTAAVHGSASVGSSPLGSSVVGTTGIAGTTSADGSANLDPITGEPGAHPVGTAVGATAGGVAAGAAVGSVAGPVGTVLGAAAGAVVGGLAGKGVAEKVDPTVPPKR